MKRSILMAVAATSLIASLGFAQPGVKVTYFKGVPQIQLDGSYPRSLYTIYRAPQEAGPFSAITNYNTLCVGPCYAQDDTARPGRVYWYRFDLIMPEGNLVSYGPFPVMISLDQASRVRASMFPNPSAGFATVKLFLAGASTDPGVLGKASLLDLQGRTVRTLFSGRLPRGETTLSWDGRSDRGRAVPPGTYFLRFTSPEGTSIKRIVRVR